MMRRAAAAILAALVLASGPVRADEKAALGTWDAVASTPDGAMPSVMTVTKAEGKIKVEVVLAGVNRQVSEESLVGDLLKLKVEYDGVVYAIQARVANDAMEGTWEGGGNAGTLTAKRRP
jgi:hypothetical protein